MAERKTTRKKTSTKATSPRAKKDSLAMVSDYSDSSMEESSQPKQSFKRSSRYIVIVLIILILIGLAFWKKEWFVVAIVNGKPITRLELSNKLIKQNGANELTSLINERLIEDEAKKKNITISYQE